MVRVLVRVLQATGGLLLLLCLRRDVTGAAGEEEGATTNEAANGGATVINFSWKCFIYFGRVARQPLFAKTEGTHCFLTRQER